MATGGNINVCANCDKWWRDPVAEKPVVGFCRRDMVFDESSMAGRAHRTEALHLCAAFMPRSSGFVGAGSGSGGVDYPEPALFSRLLMGAG